jgi:thiamine-phosphate pyrophosphorylase
MKLIVITTETFFESETEAVNLLFEHGLEVLHLRKPLASQDETEFFIRQIKTDFHPRIVLHDYYGFAELFRLKGIHLNHRNWQQGTPLPDVVNGHPGGECNLSVSRSCHSFDDISASGFCDYVFLSPVFDSISKTGYKQAFTPQQLFEAKERQIIDENVIALGGITSDNIPVARRYRFGGVAVLGALWGDFAANGNGVELLKRFNELKNKCILV